VYAHSCAIQGCTVVVIGFTRRGEGLDCLDI
jgi:hypothetical protein